MASEIYGLGSVFFVGNGGDGSGCVAGLGFRFELWF